MKTIRSTTYLCLIIFLLSSCEDSAIEDVTDKEAIPQQEAVSVDQAKKYFFDYLDDLKFTESDDLIRVPVWSRAITVESDSAAILSVPLIYVGESYKANISRNLLLYRSDNKQDLKSLIQVLIIDESELESEDFQRDPTSFFGALIFEDWHKGPLYGYTIVDGKTDETIYNLKKTYDNGRQTQTNGCTPSADIYDCTHTFTYFSGNWNYNGVVCDWIDVEWTCTPDVPGYMVSALNTTSTYYGHFPSPVFPHSVDLRNIRDCIKGIFESVKNAVHFHGQAATKAVQIMQSGAMPFDIYQYFEKIYDPNSPFVIKFVEGNLTGETTAEILSTVPIDRGNRHELTVTFDSDYLNNATDLSIARTIIHESIHAFMLFGAYYDLGPAFKDVNKLLFDGNGTYTGHANQHEQMAVTYVDEIATLLQTFANNQGITPPVSQSQLQEYYELLAFGGLDGTDGWNILVKNKTKARNIIFNEKEGNNNSSRTHSC